MVALTTSPGPASVVALGAATCAAVPWRVKGQLRLTVVVKASFALVPGAPMTLGPPEDIVRAEAHHRNAPTQSVRLTTDLAPFLPATDALLTGYACAPEGAPVKALTVRFAIFRERALLEKLIHVYGDRTDADMAPFERMPLVYERAFGGLGSKENPLGTGTGAHDKAPNLIDPADPQKTAGFGPISATWPSRKRMLDKAQQDGLKHAIVEIAGELSFQYFHAAPLDQRITPYLKGNEWIVLDGMHPTQRSVQSRLPDAAAAARIYGLGPQDGREVSLVADTLRVDAERMTCSLVWRGHLPVPDEATLSALEVVGGVALPDQPIQWPERLAFEDYESMTDYVPTESLPAVRVQVPERLTDRGAVATASFDGTMDLTPGADPAGAGRGPLPFVAGGTAGSVASPAPSPRSAPHPPPAARSFDGTMAITADEVQSPSAPPPLPFAPAGAAGSAPAPAPAPPPPSPDRGSTASITPEDEQAADGRPAVPFAAPPPRPSPFAMGLQPAPFPAPEEAPAAGSPAAPTFLKKAPRTLLGVQSAPVVAAAAAPRRKAERTALGIELFPDGPLEIAVVPWGLAPSRDTLTVVAKATCDLAVDGPAVPRPQADPPSREAHAGAPARCVYPSDLVPFKVRADVVLVGHAFAPGGSATSMEIAFRFGSEDNGFARTLRVSGDRRWQKGRAALEPSAPEPFERMPVAFDRAFGGPRFEPNPAGIGHHDPMRIGPCPLPNLEDPEHLLRTPKQAPEPAAFAPIPLAWKDRWADKREGPLCLADTLDWTRFQAAPRPQQLAFLRGDEPFAIAGLSARHPSIEGALPGIRARCFASWKPEGGRMQPGGGRFEEVALRLDTVVIDVDAMKVSLVWRGAIPVADEQRPEVEALHLLAEGIGAETSLADARAKLLRP